MEIRKAAAEDFDIVFDFIEKLWTYNTYDRDICNCANKTDMLLGNKIRSLRDEQGILQRQVAAYLEIDTPMFSKIERGDRRAKRSQVIQMATYFKVDEKEMLTLWLADKVLDALEGEDELKLTAIETVKDELMDVNR